MELHQPGWVNHELQAYIDSPQTIYIENSTLVLKPVEIKNPDGTVSYVSGRVNTQHKQDFQYGIFEARIKVPALLDDAHRGRAVWSVAPVRGD